MEKPEATDQVRKYLAAAGAQGGKTVTPKKLAHLHKISKSDKPLVLRKRRQAASSSQIPAATAEVRTFLGSIGAKGGKTVTEKKRTHLKAISSKGGKSLSPRKLAALQAMREKRLAKLQLERKQ